MLKAQPAKARPWSAGGNAHAGFSAGEYEAQRRRVRRLDPSASEPLALVGHAHEGVAGGKGEGFVEGVQRNVSELRKGIIGRLDAHPQLRALLDSDIKEMQLHLDRLMLHSASEKEAYSKAVASLKEEHTAEISSLKQEHASHLLEMEERVRATSQDAARRVQEAEAGALSLVADHVQSHSRREQELHDEWQERVRDLTEQLRADMDAQATKMKEELHAAHERDKQAAMKELTEELIGRIEEEMMSTHREEISRYQRRLAEHKRHSEELTKALEEKLRGAHEALEDEKDRVSEAMEGCMQMAEELTKRDDTISEIGRYTSALEARARDAEVAVLRLEGAMVGVMASVSYAERGAHAAAEAAASEEEGHRRVVVEMQERHVRELQDIKDRVRRAVETKERENAQLAARLTESEARLAESEAVLEQARWDLEHEGGE